MLAGDPRDDRGATGSEPVMLPLHQSPMAREGGVGPP